MVVRDWFISIQNRRDDRRKYPRAVLFSHATLHHESLSFQVIISNISLSGLCFHVRGQLTIGQTVVLEIERRIPGLIIKEAVQGTIVGMRGGGLVFSHGMQFIETLNPKRQPFLCDYIESIGRVNP